MDHATHFMFVFFLFIMIYNNNYSSEVAGVRHVHLLNPGHPTSNTKEQRQSEQDKIQDKHIDEI